MRDLDTSSCVEPTTCSHEADASIPLVDASCGGRCGEAGSATDGMGRSASHRDAHEWRVSKRGDFRSSRGKGCITPLAYRCVDPAGAAGPCAGNLWPRGHLARRNIRGERSERRGCARGQEGAAGRDVLAPAEGRISRA